MHIIKKIGIWVGSIFVFLILISSFNSDPYALIMHDKLITLAYATDLLIFLMIIPIMLISNFMGIRKKIFLFKNTKILPEIMASIISSIIIIIAFSLTISVIESSFTPEYTSRKVTAEAKRFKADRLIKQQADAKIKAAQQVIADNNKKTDDLVKQQIDSKKKSDQQVIADNKKKAANLIKQQADAKQTTDQQVVDAKNKADELAIRNVDTKNQVNDIIKSTINEIKNLVTTDNKYVLSVKNGSLSTYPNTKIVDAFNSFFASPKWENFKSTDDQNVVEFTGYCMYANTKVKSTIQFILIKNNYFNIGALTFNDVPQSQLIENELFKKAFEQYSLSNNSNIK
ncbi:hypothetical protein [Clostridium estertheticum]|uniref:hypothetical protein n=1 Tax=Clostridium estertheticum TaxID=238834 RepID=UPI001C0D2DB8|nr:hypothetical protein [Clostridium estertheticum]MBU3075693.1 hypothetical protein [Clostridium estertheticum]MBU3165805.1 hypothetical protein [Clostridium estertheticum]